MAGAQPFAIRTRGIAAALALLCLLSLLAVIVVRPAQHRHHGRSMVHPIVATAVSANDSAGSGVRDQHAAATPGAPAHGYRSLTTASAAAATAPAAAAPVTSRTRGPPAPA